VALIVQKYGGTSVGTVERIHRVAERVERAQKDGHQVVVVLSAMSGETDRMLKLAHEVTGAPDERELDMLLSTGERVTIALLAMELRGRGVNARSFTGRQVGIHTDSAHTKARISRVTADRIKEALSAGVIPVVAGFQGINASSDVTTLGRGGSDLTAVALAAALKADRCIIYTDVDGVYTADPNIVPAARRLDKISYEEMLEMASLGAKVLQSRSVEFAAKYSVPVEVNSSFKEGKGTLVTREDADMEGVMVSGVTGDRNQAKITIVGVPDRPGIAARVFGAVAQCQYRSGYDHPKRQPGLHDRHFVHGPQGGLAQCRRPRPASVRRDRRPVRGCDGIHRQGIAYRGGYAVTFRSGGKDVRGAFARRREHHDDQHVGN
jgi:aspartate kinase